MHKEQKMAVQLVTLPDTPVLYVRETGPYKHSAEKAWNTLCSFAGPRGLLNQDSRFIGISHDNPQITESPKLRYDACITFKGEIPVQGQIGKQTIPGGRFAVVLHTGSYNKLSKTYDAVFATWLPESGEKLRDQPCLEFYLNDAHTTPEAELKTEIYIPIE